MSRPSPLRRWWRFIRLTWAPRIPRPVLTGRFDPRPGTRTTHPY